MLGNFIADWVLFSILYYLFCRPSQCVCPIQEKRIEEESSYQYWDNLW